MRSVVRVNDRGAGLAGPPVEERRGFVKPLQQLPMMQVNQNPMYTRLGQPVEDSPREGVARVGRRVMLAAPVHRAADQPFGPVFLGLQLRTRGPPHGYLITVVVGD